ncbi:transketolase family protein [Antarctobacter heliothermus]|uniref:Transketolase n=1 Tax=Antarctobacter heliothermus TaxID=74033 RepID=A0A239HC20_9RHOB|nr:transketolase family protein [Antarctobacter heliothermus]SNS78976.1 transketolase [Antarctobacter heliothermus]
MPDAPIGAHSRRKPKSTPRTLPTSDSGARLTTSAMIASLDAEGRQTVAAPFGHALCELAKTRQDIVGLTADLSKYTDLHVFAKQYPDRFYQMGMAEQVMISAAAGLAREGFTPFATTYAVFASRRAYDFICMAIAEENLPVKIVCALPGLTTGYGPSHQATEDIAILRGMPNLTIVDPCCATEITQATHAIANHPGPVYMRLLRGQVPDVLGDYGYTFQLGKAQVIHGGSDVLFISTGFMTMRALDAARALKADGTDCAVLHVPTIKPLDTDTIRTEAAKTGRLVVTLENHSITGGLGEAVAADLMRAGIHPTFHSIALPDEFLDAGALPTLHDQYGLSVNSITTRVKSWL